MDKLKNLQWKKIGGITGIILVVIAGIWGIVNKSKKAAYSVSIIGGADGPTSVFLAGRVGDFSFLAGGAVIAVIVIVLLLIYKKKK